MDQLLAQVEGQLSIAEREMVNAANLLQDRLGAELKALEKAMEDLRKDRLEAQTEFENTMAKIQRLFDILSTVLKAIKEMHRTGLRI
ncbi:hypothetical protein ACFL3S_10045 [Gemmatimonadota bacterium]